METPTFFIPVAVGEGGQGWQVGDTFSVGGGAGAVGTVLTIDTAHSNSVTSVSMSGGTGYSSGSGFTTTAISGIGVALQVDILASGGAITQGQVTGAGFAGFGWAVNDTGHLFISAGVRNAVFKVLTVNAFGSILTVSITTPGSGYPANRGMVSATNASGLGTGGIFQITTSAGTVTAAQIQQNINGFGFAPGDTGSGGASFGGGVTMDFTVNTVDSWGGVLTFTVTFVSPTWPIGYYSPNTPVAATSGSGEDLYLYQASAFPGLNVCSSGPAPTGPTVQGWLVVNEPI